MNNKPAARNTTIALAVVMAFGQLAISNLAHADNVREWGYWDAATAAGPNSQGQDGFNNLIVENFNSNPSNTAGQDGNSDANTTRFNRGTVIANAAVVTEPQSQYVAYTWCNWNCNGDYRYSNNSNGLTNPGKVNFDFSKGAERVADRQHNEHFNSYYGPYGRNDVTDTSFYDGSLVVNGTYNGAAFNVNDKNPNIVSQTTTYTYNYPWYIGTGSYSNNYVQSQTDNTYFYIDLSNSGKGGYSSPYSWGSIAANNTSGSMVYGKRLDATQIAEQMRLGQTYNFSGYSQMGSNVQIAVNFANASWNGKWSSASSYNYQTGQYGTLHNGYSAAGTISGATLASSSVTGTGVAGVGYVTGGTVNATLVGTIKGTDASAAAVIGGSMVQVQQAVGTKNVGDVFVATPANSVCKGCNS